MDLNSLAGQWFDEAKALGIPLNEYMREMAAECENSAAPENPGEKAMRERTGFSLKKIRALAAKAFLSVAVTLESKNN